MAAAALNLQPFLVDLEAGAICFENAWDFLENYCTVKYGLVQRNKVKHMTAPSNQRQPLLVRSVSKQRGRIGLASRHIVPGETLLSAPGIVIVNYKYVNLVCGFCFESFTKRASSISKCEECDEVWFCVDCFEKGMVYHKPLCGALSTLSQVISKFPFKLDHDIARLALHVLNANAVQSSKEETAHEDVFTLPLSLISHQDKLDDEQCKTALAGGAVLLKLLGLDKVISEVNAAELLLQIRFNAHSSASLNETNGGLTKPNALLGFFPNAATLNHSCRPNSLPTWKRIQVNGSTSSSSTTVECGDIGEKGDLIQYNSNYVMLELKCTSSIEQGEEVTFSYLSDQLLQNYCTRRELLSGAFLFKCECVRCVEEEHFETKPFTPSSSSPILSDLTRARGYITNAMQQLTLKSAHDPHQSVNASSRKLDDAILSELMSIVSNKSYIHTQNSVESELFSDACGCVMLSRNETAVSITAKSLIERWLALGFSISLQRAELMLMLIHVWQRQQKVNPHKTRSSPSEAQTLPLELSMVMVEAYSIYSTILGSSHAVPQNLFILMKQHLSLQQLGTTFED